MWSRTTKAWPSRPRGRPRSPDLLRPLIADEEGTPRLPVVGGNSRCAWLVQDAHSLFHKWRVVVCAEPSDLSAIGSQALEREQHLTGRNKQKRYLDRQAKLLRDVDGLFNVRVDGSIEFGVRGGWPGARDRGVGYPVLTASLGRCTCSYIDIGGVSSYRGSSNLWRLLSLSSHSLASIVDQYWTRV